ncbi:GyrI-like domain-containing protein [Shimia aestuarii]|uniref:GyrI-like small molecule binding domain-containing protein n=1 Tax=Shimia aestuarii TaxID=254406 RepID=A0A1I4MVU6_9RHOB|nr:GyrI-like domain-containing protein [Shimia aestuarii]SFM07185.1 hypothetical protein SAMN04488042_103264 [Shimia aestuarii]
MTGKLDFKKSDKAFYAGKQARWDRLTIPAMTFLCITGQGDPNGPTYARALAVLYPVAYAIKFAHKARGADFVVPPLEALWWADDPSVFVSGTRSAWQWTAQLRLPDDVTQDDLDTARDNAAAKLSKKGSDTRALAELRHETRTEGDCLQTLHIGPYTDEAPTLAHLHDVLMPEQNLTFHGPHHEIYLSDPRRTAPEKLRTLLRQPVQPVTSTG